jgi:hypothetical protein
VIRFVDQRTGNLRNKTIKEQMYTKNKTIWKNSFSSFNILLLLPQPALCNISLLKTIYTILSNSLFFSYSLLSCLQSQRKICFLYIHQFVTIELFLEQFNCSWDKLFLEQLMDNFGTISVRPKSAPPSQRPSPG